MKQHLFKNIFAKTLCFALLSFSAAANAANNDASVSNLVIERLNYAVGEQVNFKFVISNNGTNTIDDFVVEYKINGLRVKLKTFAEKIISGRKITLTDSVITEIESEQMGVELTIDITSVNGQSDEDEANNTVSEKINVYKYLYDRNVVIEEGTGTWCGWCVRGIVAMEKMREEHPDDFIGIAVHNNDQMTVKEYTESMGLPTYPSCDLNREERGLSVDSSSFESYYQFGKMQKALGETTITATELTQEGKLKVKTDTEFCYTGTHDYNIAVVLVEDSVAGYYQANYYSGGENGAMGGFENMPNPVSIIFQDVARGIYPSYDGETITTNVTQGDIYTHECLVDFPIGIQHKSNLSIVALLIDAETGIIINAVKKHLNLKDDNVNTGGDDGNGEQQIGDFKCIDMGLSVLWATANMLGADNSFSQADSEEICGGYFGWADPTGLLTETEDSYYPSGDVPTEISGTELDIAHVKWGGSWRLPTHDEFVELYNNCTVTPETVNGVNGSRFTSVINGNSIFLPYNGDRYGTDVWGFGDYGNYWSGTLWEESFDDTLYAFNLDFDDYGVNINCVAYRYDGMGVRPVCDDTTTDINIGKTNGKIISTEYVSVSGVALDKLTKGLTLIKERHDDGSVTTRKVFIK